MKCWIFDLDGTFANGDHRLHLIQPTNGGEKKWDEYFSLCPLDEPIMHMIILARRIAAAKEHIVIVTGRSDQVRFQTEKWLDDNAVPYSAMFMRPQGDYTDDDKLKIKFLEMMKALGWEPIMAFDDRTRVVNAWRAAGVPCAQVAPGDF